MLSPMLTAVWQAAALASLSNVLAQILEAWRGTRSLDFSFTELLRFMIFTLVTAPPNYIWQEWLERQFPGYFPAAKAGNGASSATALEGFALEEGRTKSPVLSWKNTFIKWLIDCMTIGHFVNIAAFFVLMGIMKGQSRGQFGKTFKEEFMSVVIDGYKIWPIASVVNFIWIPVERRIVFLNFVGLLWGIYLSIVAARV